MIVLSVVVGSGRHAKATTFIQRTSHPLRVSAPPALPTTALEQSITCSPVKSSSNAEYSGLHLQMPLNFSHRFKFLFYRPPGPRPLLFPLHTESFESIPPHLHPDLQTINDGTTSEQGTSPGRVQSLGGRCAQGVTNR